MIAEPRSRHALGMIGILLAITMLAGCGQRGPLTLPGSDDAVVAAPEGDAAQTDQNDDDDENR
jgi:predicted small lipoprotein YifL